MSSVVGSRGLLLMSSKRTQFAARARQCLLSVKQEKCDTLYIYFMKEHDSSSDPIKSKPTSTYQHEMTTSVLSHYTSLVYSQASAICPSIDVRLLLKHRELTSLRTLPSNAPLPSSSHSNSNGIENPMCRPLSSIECILAESCIPRQEVDHFLETNILRSHYQAGEIPFKVIDSEVALADNHDVKIHVDQTQDSINGLEIKKDEYRVVVLGGTFDRLHNGHKVLLMESVIRCTSEIIIGVTDDTMIQKKSLCDLIQPTALRIANVVDFLRDVAPSLIHRVVPIHDAFGPAILEDNIDLIVVSEETSQGAKRINEIRAEKNFHPLLVHTIQLFPEVSKESEHEEDKISSSSKRLRLLGQRLKLAMKPPSKPYIIGLTGGIASGKSNICKYLEEVHEISTIDCDKLGHEAYKPNTPCLEQIVSIFGSDILNSDGGIERRSLGAKVFGDSTEMKKLTDIVWPEIRRLAENRITQLAASEKKIIILDAAIMVEAGWETLCHELWVTFIPRVEAIQRVQNRDGLSYEYAAKRVDAQITNQERLSKATFAFSSLWEPEFTRTQVTKALNEVLLIVDAL